MALLDPDRLELKHDDVADEVLFESVHFAQRERDVLEHAERAVERTLLEQHAPALADPLNSRASQS